MIAPEPFFEPRGTPFSEYFRIKALSELGHSVDLITYPIGEDKSIPGLRIFRSFRPPFIKSVKTGPSFTKILLDFFLFFRVLFRLFREDYDLIHTHEEANIMGVFFNKMTKIPHLYDMHSSLVQQMANFKFTKSKVITGFFKFIEKAALKNAKSIIVICKALFDYAGKITSKKKLTIIENFMDDTPEKLESDKLSRIEQEIRGEQNTIVTYTGTLEAYQGIPLLLDSMIHLDKKFHLVLIGGTRDQIDDVSRLAEKRGLEKRIKILGSKPPQDIPYYLKVSDVLVSPRILGTNIPLKIYSYLKSGVPVVATNLYTHTQSINDSISVLAEAEPKKFAQGILYAASEEGKRISRNAIDYCKNNYSRHKYIELVAEALTKGNTKL
jgi:glycosyltransferase involved in cell wall biosynthesis